MTHSREFHAPCKSGDNAELSVTHSTYDDDGDDTGPDNYISFKTSRGKAVWLNMRTARELAAWLIEHAIDPDDDPHVVTVPPGHGVAMFGGGGAGGVAISGAGGGGAYGGRGGNGGSATIVQRTV